ncbi:hypothetical protein [Helicobacter felis]|uniref:hypothetical protein n=2 Tax=Helicobacter felis TaxID=214 RepID=UPI0013159667|nr:hypothetical protein [Helicobacter felis]
MPRIKGFNMSATGIVLIVIAAIFGILVIGAVAQIFTAVGKAFEDFFKSPVSIAIFVITLLVIFHYVGK